MRKKRCIVLFLLYFCMMIGIVYAESSGVAYVGLHREVGVGVAHVLGLPIEISARTFGLAIVAIALALCALAFYSKRNKDKYEEED